ncbi:hypothetical protein A9264_14265 [Vibrio sp. UCD-FRSSP16_10]|uniref:hypothetical protein n=1 Tax=unclassified Vibrio TaxID=2614977 RepID=UPI0007FB84BD|nr:MULTISPECIES: hypothetical protein [unclassified Vibrio]OBT13269.1 hypothetical protein A9260_14645 [Vibrio sp. UCD-FRSSP16_30]OBT19619.1 hypothetical protein A9264_14265 [Vibrio sp. UCD-FRSSP16_10]
MNSYQILCKSQVVLAVNLGNDNATEEIASLIEQGFVAFSRVIQAVSEERALAIYRAENPTAINSPEANIKNIFFFKTNQLQRLAYVGYSLASFLFVAVCLVILFEIVNGSANGSLMILAFPVLIAAVWFGGGLSIARWKNCGNRGWVYCVVALVAMLMDIYLMGLASTLLWLYLIFWPQSKNLS